MLFVVAKMCKGGVVVMGRWGSRRSVNEPELILINYG